MDFNLFMYCTIGRRAELEAGMAGTKPELYQRMLSEIAEYATYADQAATADSVTPNITSRSKASRSPTIHCSCPCGSANTRNVYASSPAGSSRPRIIRCERRRASPQWTTCWAGASGSVSFADIKRAGSTTSVFARTCKRSALEQELEQDTLNREYFEEFVEIVVKALTHETFYHQGKFLDLPAGRLRQPASALGLRRLWPGCCSRYACQRGWHRSTAAAVAASTALRRDRVDDDGEILGAVCRAADRPRRRPRFLQNHLVCLSRRSRQTQPQHRPW